METIIGVVIGGVLAVAGGIIGNLIQSSRDHAKCVREQRFAALYDLLEMVDGDAYRIRMKMKHDTSTTGMVQMQRVASKLAFVAPQAIKDATEELVAALAGLSLREANSTERLDRARSVYLVEAQKILKTNG